MSTNPSNTNSAITARATSFAPPLQKIEDELAVASFVDNLLNPLENDISVVTIESLHHAHRSLQEHGIARDHAQPCLHHHRFVQLIKNRVHYVSSRGWFLERLNGGVKELQELKKFLPPDEQAKIDHEIRTLDKTRAIILEEHQEQKKIFKQHKKLPGLLGRLKRIVSGKR